MARCALLKLTLLLTLISTNANAAGISEAQVKNFVTNHVKIVRGCTAQTIGVHLKNSFTPDFIKQNIESDGSRTNLSIGELISDYVDFLSDPDEARVIRPLCAAYKMSVGNIDVKSDRAVFTTVENFDGDIEVCKNTLIKQNGRLMLKNALCKYKE